MKVANLLIISFIIFSSLNFISFSQTNENLTSSVSNLTNLFEKAIEKYYSKTLIVDSLINLDQINLKSNSNIETWNKDSYYQSKIKLAKGELGIRTYGDALQNLNSFDVDTEDNLLYQRRYQLGLEWNLLDEGFFERKSKIDKINFQKLLDSVKGNINENIDIDDKQYCSTIYWFNVHKLNLIKEREEFLYNLENELENLYYKKVLSKEKLLLVKNSILELNSLKKLYTSFNKQLNIKTEDSIFFSKYLPEIYDFNLDSFFYFSNNYDYQNKLFYQYNNLKQESWVNAFKLKVYTRYNFYQMMPISNNRSFFNVGLQWSTALPFNIKKYENVKNFELLKQIEDVNLSKRKEENNLLNDVYDYQYKLKQLTVFYAKKRINDEKIRKEWVKLSLNEEDFNPINALMLLNEQYLIENELLDIRQNLNIHFLKIKQKLDINVQSKIMKKIDKNLFKFSDFPKSVYLWSNVFINQSPEIIIEYIMYNDFSSIKMSVSLNDSLINKKLKVAEELQKRNVEIELMFGQNSFINEQNFLNIAENILSYYKTINYKVIHLDIEPHALAEWKINKVETQNKYLALLDVFKNYCVKNNKLLSVDLPLSIDSNFYKEIISKVDLVCLMSYENIKEEYLIRKSNELGKIFGDVSFSFRTEDFNSRSEMESFIKKIRNKLQTKIINYHDLHRLIELDRKAIEYNEKY